MASDNSSLKSTSSKPKTPSEGGKRVGFARPTLIIPPNQTNASFTPYTANTGLYTAGTGPYSAAIGPTPEMYGRKASMFVFGQLHGLKDFTWNTAKSGLGIGEKCSFWLYNKVKSWSRKWFTHFFLTIVILIYTVGGAVTFVYTEGPAEEPLSVRDNREDMYQLVRMIGNLSKEMPQEEAINNWKEKARVQLDIYKTRLLEAHSKKKLIEVNRGNKLWTLMNAIVYCATIYTSIGTPSSPCICVQTNIAPSTNSKFKIVSTVKICHGTGQPDSSKYNLVVVIMDTLQTPTENRDEQNGSEIQNKDVDMARIEAMVTPEQVFSDSVARRRRKFTKKRSTSLTRRETTPARHLDDKLTTTSDEEVLERRPKTPERRRPRRTKSATKRDISGTDSELGRATHHASHKVTNGNVNNGDKSKTKIADEKKKKESMSDVAQAEVISFLNKTKRSITAAAIRGRDRFRKTEKELVKRSQSAPHQFTEEELIESFKKAQLLSAEKAPRPRKFSDSSVQSVMPEVPFQPRPFRPEVQEFVRQRKKQKQYSSKVIEVLDPKTSCVIARKTVIKPDFTLRDLFRSLRMFSIFEIRKHYRAYKLEMREEYDKIRKLWTKCMCELFLIMILCGIAGMVFKFTEGSFENFYKCGVKRVKRDFIDLLWIKSHNLREEDWKSLARNRLRVFEEELHAAHEAGMTSYSGQRSWSFLNGIVFALTVITTIGYGHLCPSTVTGRILTIVYALIGIPLFLIALTDFGKLFTRCIKFLWSFVRRLYYTGSCRSVRKTAHVQEIFQGAQMMYDIATFRRPSMVVDPENPDAYLPPQFPHPTTAAAPLGPVEGVVDTDTPTTPALSNFEIDDEFNLPISVALFILISYIFIGAVIYWAWEGWNFFAAFYFVFISMSTIGFGDYVPRKPACMIVSIVYLVFGLALMTMCINVVQEKLSDTFKRASVKLGATIGFEVDEDGSILTVPPETVEIPPVHEDAVGESDKLIDSNKSK
ncbi:hypothetical protein NQ315_010790 [Exocentrus adspersus]|uniref:Potassium channel domain-containing protein n=1 Tax=Exocentrus adspersus TaxID=1586481 RepID=A0AAV8VUY1_9CUCU|nr:hypothetical protein NQ315_010790 [Exocentrus adspersus]